MGELTEPNEPVKIEKENVHSNVEICLSSRITPLLAKS